jgi:hypothetical protein
MRQRHVPLPRRAAVSRAARVAGKAPAEHILGAVAHVAKFEKGVLVERPEQAATTEVAA